MSTEKILQEIEENPIQEIATIEENSNKPVVIKVDLITRRKILHDWLNGAEPKDIGSAYGLPTISVNKIIDSNEPLRLEIEKKYFATASARENYRISETKNNLISYVNKALDEALDDSADTPMTPERKIKFLNNIALIFDKLDSASRLNMSKPTSVTENRNTNINVAEIVRELRTPEEKLDFLRNQSKDIINNQ